MHTFPSTFDIRYSIFVILFFRIPHSDFRIRCNIVVYS